MLWDNGFDGLLGLIVLVLGGCCNFCDVLLELIMWVLGGGCNFCDGLLV